jgi:hypothetical protein
MKKAMKLMNSVGSDRRLTTHEMAEGVELSYGSCQAILI